MLEVNPRIKNAHAWWLASEIVRRHPELVVQEDHPLGGFYDGLKVWDPRAEPSNHSLFISRTASAHAFRGDAPSNIIGLDEALSLPEPFEAVTMLEGAAGLIPPPKTPTATPRSLAYRLLARLLLSTVNEREPWDVRSASRVERIWDGGPFVPHPDAERFPFSEVVIRAAEQQPAPYDHPARAVWRVLRGDVTLALVSSSGHVASASGVRALMPLYRRSGRALLPTLADALGEALG